jgi:hypothetical protein
MDMHYSDRRARAYCGAREAKEVEASMQESGPGPWKATTMNEETHLVSDRELAR